MQQKLLIVIFDSNIFHLLEIRGEQDLYHWSFCHIDRLWYHIYQELNINEKLKLHDILYITYDLYLIDIITSCITVHITKEIRINSRFINYNDDDQFEYYVYKMMTSLKMPHFYSYRYQSFTYLPLNVSFPFARKGLFGQITQIVPSQNRSIK